MSDDAQHERDCEIIFGQGYPHVHTWIDARFADLGPIHRFARHHIEGVAEARALFGHEASRAALIHILRDCLHLPRRVDYRSSAVDALGIPASMSIRDVVSFNEEAFMELAKRHLDLDSELDILIWAWLRDEDDIGQLIRAVSSDTATNIEEIRLRWVKAKQALEFRQIESTTDQARFVDIEYAESLEGFEQVRSALEQSHGPVRFGFVKTSALINPLMVIDREFVNFLKQELAATGSEADAVSFAFPNRVNVRVRTLSDARSATVITRFHQFSLSHVGSEVVDDSGIEVKFSINPIPQLIIVTEAEGRYYLKAGMHRAFILAQAGYTEIPCFVISQPAPPVVNGPYPAYSPDVLSGKRPPMLQDAFDPTFTSLFRYQRTDRVLRIAAEDFSIPVE